MTTTEYWTTNTAGPPALADPRTTQSAVNWRLWLAVGLNIAAWAAILKTL